MIVYCIKNKQNGKCYVGQTVKTLRRRWTLHYNNGRSGALSNAINKYGKESFETSILQNCSSAEENKMENSVEKDVLIFALLCLGVFLFNFILLA